MSEMTYAEWQRERTTVMEEARARADAIAALRADLAAKEAEIGRLRGQVRLFRDGVSSAAADPGKEQTIRAKLRLLVIAFDAGLAALKEPPHGK